jgi:hypothetical protein
MATAGACIVVAVYCAKLQKRALCIVLRGSPCKHVTSKSMININCPHPMTQIVAFRTMLKDARDLPQELFL